MKACPHFNLGFFDNRKCMAGSKPQSVPDSYQKEKCEKDFFACATYAAKETQK